MLHNTRRPVGGDYDVCSFRSDDNRAAAAQVHQIQAEAYRAAGYVTGEAVMADGSLDPSIDTARGMNVLYFLARPRSDRAISGAASARLVTSPTGRLKDLHALKVGGASLAPGWRRHIEAHFDAHGPESVAEVAGLSKSADAGRLAPFEVIRAMFHYSVLHPVPMLWIATLVGEAHRALEANFGDRALARTGAPVASFGDPSTISPSLTFVPVLIEPRRLLSGLLESVEYDPDPQRRDRVARSAVFMADGLRASQTPEGIRSLAAGDAAWS